MNKKVTVTFEDKYSLTVDEIKANLLSAYGNNAEVTVNPVNDSPLAHIYFGISELLTEKQAEIFFDQPEQYEIKLKALRHSLVKELLHTLNDVIMDNEESFSS